jgi:hypothetical protein
LRTTDTEDALLDFALRLVAPSHVLIMGALGGALTVLFYKSCELIVRGFLGEGFEFTATERATTAGLIIAIAILISLVPSRRRQIEALRRENEDGLQALKARLEQIRRERT